MEKKNHSKQKVYIICTKEEYEFVWKHLHDIMNTQEQELIVPFGFMNYELNDQNINKMANQIMYNLPILKIGDASTIAVNEWLNRKLEHFQTYVEDADLIIILQNNSFSSADLDMEEKNMEVNLAAKLPLPIQTINTKDLEDKVYTKTTIK